MIDTVARSADSPDAATDLGVFLWSYELRPETVRNCLLAADNYNDFLVRVRAHLRPDAAIMFAYLEFVPGCRGPLIRDINTERRRLGLLPFDEERA